MPRIAHTEVIIPRALSAERRHHLTEELYAVHRRIFDGVERDTFARYVVESEAEHNWIQVHRNEAGEVAGYFALHVFERQVGGRPAAVFRAEAGSLRAYRGSSITMRFGLKRVLGYLLRNPGRKAYYLGSLVHPSSYTMLAHHFGTVWPQWQRDTPPELLASMEALASEFGIERVDPGQPLVRRVGWRTRETEMEREYWRHCDKPAARFFLEANPGYAEGHGLMTLVPLDPANVMRLARTVLGRRLRQPVEATRNLARRLPGAARLRRTAVVHQLRSSPPFARLEAQAQESLAASAEELTLPAGRYVFRKGDSGDELYVLTRGAAYVLEEGGAEEKVVDELGSGAVFGEISFLGAGRRSMSIRTVTASALLRIPRSALLPMLEAYPALRQSLWETLAERQLEDLVRDNARYGSLGRKGRRAWLQRGEQLERAAHEAIPVEAGTSMLVLMAPVEIEHVGGRTATRGPALVEALHPLRVVPQERARLFLLPRLTPPSV
jgi:CRP-like cAMP-binding protein